MAEVEVQRNDMDKENSGPLFAGRSSVATATTASKSKHSPLKATRIWNSILVDFVDSMPLKRHRWRMKYVTDSFTKSEAIAWLLKVIERNPNVNQTAVSREQAQLLLQKFIDSGYVVPVNISGVSNSNNASCDGSASRPTTGLGSTLRQLSAINLTVGQDSDGLSASLSTSTGPLSGDATLFRIQHAAVRTHLANTGASSGGGRVLVDSPVATSVNESTSECGDGDAQQYDIHSRQWTPDVKARMNRAMLRAMPTEHLQQMVADPVVWTDAYAELVQQTVQSMGTCSAAEAHIALEAAVMSFVSRTATSATTLIDSAVRPVSAVDNTVHIHSYSASTDAERSRAKSETVAVVPAHVTTSIARLGLDCWAGPTFRSSRAYLDVMHHFAALPTPIINADLATIIGQVWRLASDSVDRSSKRETPDVEVKPDRMELEREMRLVTAFTSVQPVTRVFAVHPDSGVVNETRPVTATAPFSRNSFRFMSLRRQRADHLATRTTAMEAAAAEYQTRRLKAADLTANKWMSAENLLAERTPTTDTAGVTADIHARTGSAPINMAELVSLPLSCSTSSSSPASEVTVEGARVIPSKTVRKEKRKQRLKKRLESAAASTAVGTLNRAADADVATLVDGARMPCYRAYPALARQAAAHTLTAVDSNDFDDDQEQQQQQQQHKRLPSMTEETQKVVLLLIRLLLMTLPYVERTRLVTLLHFVAEARRLLTRRQHLRVSCYRYVVVDVVDLLLKWRCGGSDSSTAGDAEIHRDVWPAVVHWLAERAEVACTPPTQLRRLVEQRIYDKLVEQRMSVGEDPNPITFCDRISPAAYDAQRVTASTHALTSLLDQMLAAVNDGCRRRQSKQLIASSGRSALAAQLAAFCDAYPHIWRLRMGEMTPHQYCSLAAAAAGRSSDADDGNATAAAGSGSGLLTASIARIKNAMRI